MARSLLSVTFLVFASVASVFGTPCQFPIVLPEIRHVTTPLEAADGDAFASVVVRSTYAFRGAVWWVKERPVGFPRMYVNYPVSGELNGIRSTEETLSNGDIRLSLHTDKALIHANVDMNFDIGCTIITESVTIARTNQLHPFNPYRPGKIIRAPNPNFVFTPNRAMDIRFRVEADAQYETKAKAEAFAYRNASHGSTVRIYHGPHLAFPFTYEGSSIVKSALFTNGSYEINVRAKAPEGVQDVVAEFQFSAKGYSQTPGRTQMRKFSVSYAVNFYTAERTKPMLKLTSCHRHRQAYEEDDVLIVPQIANLHGCLEIVADGNPAPLFTLIEAASDNIVKSIRERQYPKPPSHTYDVDFYTTPPLASGEAKNYFVLVVNDEGIKVQAVRVVGYVPSDI